jgi:hypothetical protein
MLNKMLIIGMILLFVGFLGLRGCVQTCQGILAAGDEIEYGQQQSR